MEISRLTLRNEFNAKRWKIFIWKYFIQFNPIAEFKWKPAQSDIWQKMQFLINSICRWPNIVTHLPLQRWNASIHAKFMSLLTYSEFSNVDEWTLLHSNDTLQQIWLKLSDFPYICVQKVSTWACDGMQFWNINQHEWYTL